MKPLVLFDSQFGNTHKIADVIARELHADLASGHFSREALKDVSLLVVGSPTQGGRPTPHLQKLLSKLPSGSLKEIKVATFDTRFSQKDLRFPLNYLIKIFGYAAPRIAGNLKAKGGKLIAPPKGFIVTKKEGPLKEGEIEKAQAWAKSLLEKI